MKTKKIGKKGVTVTVSPEAHQAMHIKALKMEPRRTLREYVNIIHNLSPEK